MYSPSVSMLLPQDLAVLVYIEHFTADLRKPFGITQLVDEGTVLCLHFIRRDGIEIVAQQIVLFLDHLYAIGYRIAEPHALRRSDIHDPTILIRDPVEWET